METVAEHSASARIDPKEASPPPSPIVATEGWKGLEKGSVIVRLKDV
jgi:hypothetical protein